MVVNLSSIDNAENHVEDRKFNLSNMNFLYKIVNNRPICINEASYCLLVPHLVCLAAIMPES